ncbi:WXG100 family type VII secretion target [Gulosibacter chungangensis]|uniref:ESAT-6-like protein n=1 Tax=Gulosibacter chungangensis TaxID=979746 RepID=A0A7J5BC36_9MICO|nr:WXG100 family type VII secretion target [Gulosibacter chungangensis]KAB1643118.1 WXG100 family type VII secretion target [Gulosibacter chungangensis]
MAKFTVDSDLMSSTMSTAYTEIDAVQTHSAQLTTTLNTLESSWQGQGSLAFLNAVEQWRGVQTQVEEAIQQINTALGAAAEHYGTTEGDVIRLFAV